MSRWRGLAERLDESRRRGISSPALMVDTQPTLLLAGPDDSGRRLDRIVRRLLAGYPLATVYRALRLGAVRVNGKKARGEQRVAAGDEIRLDARFTAALTAPQALGEASDQTDSGVIVLERGPDLIFVSKPRGMLAHGPGGLDELCVELVGLPSSPSLAFRPAPLHRLDRNTSGIVAISASLAGALAFSRALREGRLAKYYLALLDGRLAGPEAWSDTLARDGDAKRSLRAKDGEGRLARTVVTPLAATERHTLALVRIATGLTHQIRAQAGLRGHPLSGDAKYGGSRLEGGYALHAFRLELPPDLGCHAPERVVAPLPEPAQALLRRLFGSNLDTSVLSGRFEPPKEPEFG